MNTSTTDIHATIEKLARHIAFRYKNSTGGVASSEDLYQEAWAVGLEVVSKGKTQVPAYIYRAMQLQVWQHAGRSMAAVSVGDDWVNATKYMAARNTIKETVSDLDAEATITQAKRDKDLQRWRIDFTRALTGTLQAFDDNTQGALEAHNLGDKASMADTAAAVGLEVMPLYRAQCRFMRHARKSPAWKSLANRLEELGSIEA